MAVVRSYTLRFAKSVSPDAVAYGVYYAAGADVGYSDTRVQLDASMGQTHIEVDLVQLFGLEGMDGEVTFGVTAVDDAGNESDMTKITVPFDTVAPAAPTEVSVI